MESNRIENLITQRERDQRRALRPLRADKQDPDEGKQQRRRQRGQDEHVLERMIFHLAGEEHRDERGNREAENAQQHPEACARRPY